MSSSILGGTRFAQPDLVITSIATGRFRNFLHRDELILLVIEGEWFPVVSLLGLMLVEAEDEEGGAVAGHVVSTADG